ncbi:MAG: hypothetical protein A2770_03125 [Candidatus Levybacteria bacterium RIFCSPHIGHO2_01_FULL_38_12]|nr:MAG: hypothetical protein A2770_03125 [Candidatus Levybacteria bacterium RIFCSPHIGHO2_01_FULL_38_12]
MRERIVYVPPEKQRLQESTMSEQEVSVLVSCFGNHEVKALLMAAFSTNSHQTGHELHFLLNGAQGKKPVWNIPAFRINRWCEEQFLPLGIISGDCETGYMLTSYGGQQVGLAGHFLELSEQYPDISFFGALGASNAKHKGEDQFRKTPTALVYYKIFQAITLLGETPLGAATVVTKTGANFSTVTERLSHLSSHSVLTYTRRLADEDYSFFTLGAHRPEGNPAQYGKEKTWTQMVYDILLEQPNKTFSVEQLYN